MISHRAVLEEGPKSGVNKIQGILKEKVLLLNQNTLRKIAWNAPVWQRPIKVDTYLVTLRFFTFEFCVKLLFLLVSLTEITKIFWTEYL